MAEVDDVEDIGDLSFGDALGMEEDDLIFETIPDMDMLYQAASTPRIIGEDKGGGAAFGSISDADGTFAPGSTAGPSITLSTSTAPPSSGRSPWLPPASPRGQRTPTPKRPPDPLHVPEAVGLVQPFLPYRSRTAPQSRTETDEEYGKRRRRWARWTTRHHICESKDNRRLPRLQRTYFDDLPHTRCQGGSYRMVPGHRSRNFDHFCSAPAHAQHRELHQRFERYPFVEALRLPARPHTQAGDSTMSAFSSDFEAAFDHSFFRPSSSSECSPTNSRSASTDNPPDVVRLFNRMERTPSASSDRGPLYADEPLIDGPSDAWSAMPGGPGILTAEGRSEHSDGEQHVYTATTPPPLLQDRNRQSRESSEKNLPVVKRSLSPSSRQSAIEATEERSPRSPRSPRRDSVCGRRSVSIISDRREPDQRGSSVSPSSKASKRQHGSARRHSSMAMMGVSPRNAGKATQSAPATAFRIKEVRASGGPRGTNMAKYSIFNRGGVLQFHSWAASKFGSLVRLWRCLDVHNNMRVGQGQFLRGLQDLGYSGDARELFKVLNRDQTGTLLFYHFAPEAALAVAQLLDWSRTNYGSLAALGLGSAVDQRSFITRQQFTNLCIKKGFTNQRALRHTFDLIDKDGDGSVVKTEVALLDKWEFPEWLTAKPDELAADECKAKLVAKCHGNALTAWRQMDRNGTMRVAWNDFRQVCKKMLTQEDCEALPAAWRALDDDLSGWLSLREFDRGMYDNLLRLVKWAHESAGSFIAAFPKLERQAGLKDKDTRIGQNEWRHACKSSGLDESVLTQIFFGLDRDGGGSIQMSEIRFLDQWKATADIKEEEAWAELAGAANRARTAKQKDRSPRVGGKMSRTRSISLTAKSGGASLRPSINMMPTSSAGW